MIPIYASLNAGVKGVHGLTKQQKSKKENGNITKKEDKQNKTRDQRV